MNSKIAAGFMMESSESTETPGWVAPVVTLGVGALGMGLLGGFRHISARKAALVAEDAAYGARKAARKAAQKAAKREVKEARRMAQLMVSRIEAELAAGRMNIEQAAEAVQKTLAKAQKGF